MRPNCADLLTRAALDDEFRALLVRDPEAASAGYTLTDAERATLRRLDGEMLALLAYAQRGVPYPGAAPASEPPPAPAPPAATSVRLPDSAFLLRVSPTATWTPDGAVRIDFSVSVEPASVPETPAPTAADPASLVGHTRDSDRVRAAAAAVHTAAPAVRYDAVRALLAEIARG